MNIVFTILVALPIGFLVRKRATAVFTYALMDSFIFTFQTAFLVMKWVDGDQHAFGERGRDWSGERIAQFYSYAVVNGLIVAAGIGLVLAGATLRSRRTADRAVVTVDSL